MVRGVGIVNRWRGDGIAAKWYESDLKRTAVAKKRIASRVHQFTMSSSEDADALLLVQLANLNAQTLQKKKRHYWVHPLWQKNKKFGIFNNVYQKDLKLDDEKFKLFYRMKKATFCKLLTKLRPMLQKKDTNFRKCVSPEERLLVTLR